MGRSGPTYDLKTFKSAMLRPGGLSMSIAASSNALGMGFRSHDILAVIGAMKAAHFRKTMLSDGQTDQWQDVYYVPFRGMVIYIKFRSDALTEFRILSFKDET